MPPFAAGQKEGVRGGDANRRFCLLVLMMGLGFLMDCIFIGLQAGLADAIDTYFYVFQARKGSLHGLGVHIKTLRNNHIDGTC